jgi:hypothetical protein
MLQSGTDSYLLLESVQDTINEQLLKSCINVTAAQVADHLQQKRCRK